MSLQDVVHPGEVQQMLNLLGVSSARPDRLTLGRLQRSWVFTQPFHNLDLLADFAQKRPPLERREGWQRCLQGLGGPCHVQASSFLALVKAIGFKAHFAGAHINHPGDHLVVCVRLDGDAFICDVGNGHPYTEPFALNGSSDQAHLGWVVRSHGDGRSVRVEQQTPGATGWRDVYIATPQQCDWADFQHAIQRHHSEVGFGPFLTGLRATRIGETEAYTLRDDTLRHYTAVDCEIQDVGKRHEAVLNETMGLGALPVAAAVRAWRCNSGRV